MNRILSFFKSSTKLDWPPSAYDDNDLPILLIGGYVLSNNVNIGTYDINVPIYRTKNEFRQNGKTIVKFKYTYEDLMVMKVSNNLVII